MSMRLSVATLLTTVITCSCFIAGCNQASQEVTGTPEAETTATDAAEGDYNPHDVPITDEQKAQLKEATAKFSDAVAKLKELRTDIEEATKDGIPANPYVAHQALDTGDLVLQWLPQAASDSGVAKEHWEEINTTASELRTLLDRIHENVDNKQDPDFASVATEMDEKLARLAEIAESQEATSDAG